MHQLTVPLLWVSIAVQLVAAALALLLASRRRGARPACLPIAAALVLMVGRRVLALVGLSQPGHATLVTDPLEECIALATAVLMLLGVLLIPRVFDDLVHTAAALRESEERFRALFEMSPDGLLVMDPETMLPLQFNDAACQQLGYSREEFAELRMPDHEAGETPAQAQRDIADVLAGQRGDFDQRHRTKTGDIRDVHVTAQLLPLAGQNTLYFIYRDITTRKQAQAALAASEARHRTLLDTLPQKIVCKDRNSVYLYVNRAYAGDLGTSPEEVVGRTDYDFHPRELADKYRADDQRTMESGEVEEFEENYIRDGQELVVHTVKTPVTDEQGNTHGILGIFWDVSEQRRLEQRTRQASRLEAIGSLAGGVAHDFNNLLTAILGYSELTLAGLSEDDPVRRNAQEIRKAANRAASLTHQLLAFSRKQVLEPKVTDLNVLVRDAEKMLRRIIGEDIELVTNLEPSLGRLKADPGQLTQVIMNLAANARDAMPKGGKLSLATRNIVLEEGWFREHGVARVDDDGDTGDAGNTGPYVSLSVSDTGIGMDRDTLARIFEPFFTTKSKDKGTGLGLATVYGIVKQSGGYIWAYSEPGQGTTFTIYLPRVDDPTQAGPPAPLKPASGSETVLVVEDDHQVRSLARLALTDRGFTVLEASGGDQALRLCREHHGPIHLILTDVVMPGMSGPDVVEHIARSGLRSRALYMSGYTDDAIVHHGVLHEGTHFIHKPFSPADLVRKVREVLDDGNGSSQE